MRKGAEIKVTSGELRGRKLKSPENILTHPMGAREKLALFNMVDVAGKKVLDAYAGSGALGIEALSRGAEEVVFVESNRKIAGVISENLRTLGLSGKVAVETVERFANDGQYAEYFDVIIADPPYNNFDKSEVASLVKLLDNDGIMVLSSPAKEEIVVDGMTMVGSRTYAGARLTVMRKETASSAS